MEIAFGPKICTTFRRFLRLYLPYKSRVDISTRPCRIEWKKKCAKDCSVSSSVIYVLVPTSDTTQTSPIAAWFAQATPPASPRSKPSHTYFMSVMSRAAFGSRWQPISGTRPQQQDCLPTPTPESQAIFPTSPPPYNAAPYGTPSTPHLSPVYTSSDANTFSAMHPPQPPRPC